jgi:hypothetical protein
MYLSANFLEVESILDRLDHYQQRHGHLPEPTVHQLLEADRPFRVAWADTSDKLRRADMDLRRLQRAKQMSSELLLVLDTLIEKCDDQPHM